MSYLRTAREALSDAATALVIVACVGALVVGCGRHTRTRVVEVPGPTPAPVVSVVTVTLPYVPQDPASTFVPYVPPGRWGTSPGGTRVWTPAWLEIASTRDPTLAEVDTVIVERLDAIQQGAIPAGTVGVPPGWRVVVMDGPFSTTASPSGRASGLCDHSRSTIYVAPANPAPDRNGRYLPALGHEAAHAWVGALTGDLNLAALAGH